MIIWIIGLSASGKTTLAEEMLNILKAQNHLPWVILDGDHSRALFGKSLGHTVADRRKNAERIQLICNYLESQKINVLVPILSIFPDQQLENRQKYSSYKQIYLKVDFQQLINRDNKNLYRKALSNEEKNVVGVDIKFPEPVNSDLILDNNLTLTNLHELATEAIRKLNITIQNNYKYTQNNLLIKAYRYQYTAYEGQRFLNQYINDRDRYLEEMGSLNTMYASRQSQKPEQLIKLINDCYHKHSEIESILTITQIADYLKSQQLENQNHEVVTLAYLLDLILFGQKYEIKSLLNLIRRFEVSKRIYSSYLNLDFKKIHNQDLNRLINYPLFGMALIKFHQQADATEQLIIENALLKLGDLIISAKESFTQPILALLCRFFIRAEITAIKLKYAL